MKQISRYCEFRTINSEFRVKIIYLCWVKAERGIFVDLAASNNAHSIPRTEGHTSEPTHRKFPREESEKDFICRETKP